MQKITRTAFSPDGQPLEISLLWKEGCEEDHDAGGVFLVEGEFFIFYLSKSHYDNDAEKAFRWIASLDEPSFGDFRNYLPERLKRLQSCSRYSRNAFPKRLAKKIQLGLALSNL